MPDFDPSGGVNNGDVVTSAAGAGLTMSLGWNEPQQGIVTDLDLYLYDAKMSTVVADSI